jgi:predicted acyl esterase
MPTASSHGSKAALSIAGSAIGPWTTNSELKRAADASETTAYGAEGHEYADDEGLKAHTFTCSGWYDKTATTGTEAVLGGQEGRNLAVVWGPEGSAQGTPRHTFTGHLDDFTMTAPVTEIVKWSASFKVSGEVTSDEYP